MHFSLLSLVSCVVVAVVAVGVRWHCWYAVRRRDRRREEWARLSVELRGLDADLDQVWAAEVERLRRHH